MVSTCTPESFEDQYTNASAPVLISMYLIIAACLARPVRYKAENQVIVLKENLPENLVSWRSHSNSMKGGALCIKGLLAKILNHR